jgi:cyclohexanecarboxylate-CoA ligase
MRQPRASRSERAVTETTLAIVPQARRQAMIEAGFWPDRLITDYLDRHIRERPERIAVIDGNSASGQRTALSYAELGRRVDRLAAGLARLGVGRGDVVSWQLPNWWQFTALHLAAMRLGAVSNPLMPIFRERELAFMLGLTGAKVFVVPREFRGVDYAAMAAGLRPQLPELRHVLVVGGAGETAFERLLESPGETATSHSPSPDDVIQILFTSGTTGEPKGVMHTSNTLFSNLVHYAERLRLGEGDVVLMASPIAHQTGFLYGVMLPVMLGATAVLQDVWSPARAAELIRDEGVTFTMAATPFLADLADEAERRPADFASLRMFLSAGAPIPRVLVRRAAENLGAVIISAWGMTENGAVTTTRPDDPPEKVFETDGLAMPGMEVRIVDADRRLLPPGVEGRLEVRGCSNFVGYLKRPEWYTVDEEGWFDTGDLAKIDGDGYIRLTGRSKDIIIRGGENIPVVEIEGLLYRHPDIVEAAIVAMPDARLGERACAFVATREGRQLTLAQLSEFLLSLKIAKQYLPERLEIVTALPKTPSGKIQKFRLRQIADKFGTA